MTGPPIIIVGNSRSGTSLLRLMLTCHPRFCIPPEGPFLYTLADAYGSRTTFDTSCLERFVDDLIASPKMIEWQLNSDRLKLHLIESEIDSYRDLVQAVYHFYMSETDQVMGRWGDKSGRYTIHGLRIIRKFFPDAFVIHIVRDGRDVAASYRSLQGTQSKYAPRLPSEPMEIAYEWTRHLRIIEDFLKDWPPEQQALVKYEDLVADPEGSLQELCRVLKEEYDERMLYFYQENQQKELEPTVYLSWKQKTLANVTVSQIGRWQEEMSDGQISFFEGIARPFLERYGYEAFSEPPPQIPIYWFYFKKQIHRAIKFGRQYIRTIGRS